jgi:hypothetical protein
MAMVRRHDGFGFPPSGIARFRATARSWLIAWRCRGKADIANRKRTRRFEMSEQRP